MRLLSVILRFWQSRTTPPTTTYTVHVPAVALLCPGLTSPSHLPSRHEPGTSRWQSVTVQRFQASPTLTRVPLCCTAESSQCAGLADWQLMNYNLNSLLICSQMACYFVLFHKIVQNKTCTTSWKFVFIVYNSVFCQVATPGHLIWICSSPTIGQRWTWPIFFVLIHFTGQKKKSNDVIRSVEGKMGQKSWWAELWY